MWPRLLFADWRVPLLAVTSHFSVLGTRINEILDVSTSKHFPYTFPCIFPSVTWKVIFNLSLQLKMKRQILGTLCQLQFCIYFENKWDYLQPMCTGYQSLFSVDRLEFDLEIDLPLDTLFDYMASKRTNWQPLQPRFKYKLFTNLASNNSFTIN
jgi:hypothetical protein